MPRSDGPYGAIVLHGVRPALGRAFLFEAAKEACRRLESQVHFGKIVIRVD